MKVILFGATGMVGAGALIECLADPRVTSVLSVARRPTGTSHVKLREVVHDDFFDYAAISQSFSDAGACFFCLGVSSAGMNEAKYTHLTYDLTLAAARAMASVRPDMTFSYVSGAGTDATERGRTMWARVKGRTENALLALPFRAAFMFRPGFIQPMKGVRSKTRLYQLVYDVLTPLYPLLWRVGPRFITTSENMGRALIEVSINGYPRKILETDDINRAAMREASGLSRAAP